VGLTIPLNEPLTIPLAKTAKVSLHNYSHITIDDTTKKLPVTGQVVIVEPNSHKPRDPCDQNDPHDHKNFTIPDISKEQQKQNRTQKEDVRMHTQ
jgi:hypothetical protein